MNINAIDLRHVRYFLAVADELNFSRAAQRLHMSQPPLSQQIQELEGRLETKLFARTKRKVALTQAGQHFVPIARKLLRDVEEGLYAVRAAGRGHTGEIRLGTIFSAPLVPAFSETLRRFRAHHPNVRLVFREITYAQQMQALADREVDVVFTWQIDGKTDARFRSHILSTDRMKFCVSPQHPLSPKASLSIADLGEETLFLASLQTKMPFMRDLYQLAHEQNVTPRISQESSHFTVIANVVAAGMGLGLLPDYVAKLVTPQLIAKPLRGLPTKNLNLSLAILYRDEATEGILDQFLSSVKFHNKLKR